MNNKAYQIHFSWADDILRVCITGTLDNPMKKNADKIAQTISDIFNEHKPEKVLIDCANFDGRLGYGSTYFHLREYKQSKFLPSKIAVLDKPENKAHISYQEITGKNAGLTAKYFDDSSMALRWLQE